MGAFVGKRSDVGYGIYVAGDGVNAQTCALSLLIYNSHTQAQVVKHGSYDFVAADVYSSDYYRKIISIPDQDIVPICDVVPNMDIYQNSSGGYEYRADQSTYFDNNDGDFKFKVTETQIEVICHKDAYIGFSFMVMNRGFL